MIVLGYSISDKGIKGGLQALVNVTNPCQLLESNARSTNQDMGRNNNFGQHDASDIDTEKRLLSASLMQQNEVFYWVYTPSSAGEWSPGPLPS